MESQDEGQPSAVTSPTGRGYQRILDALELFSSTSKPLTLAEVVRSLEVPKSTGWLIIQHLLARDYVRSGPGKAYRAGPALTTLAIRLVGGLTLRQIAREQMEFLNQETGLDVYLGEIIDGKPQYVDHIEGHRSVRVHIPIGIAQPWHTNSVGLVGLAFGDPVVTEGLLAKGDFPAVSPSTITEVGELKAVIAEARSSGYVFDYEGVYGELCGVGVPIFRGDSQLAGILSVNGQTAVIREMQTELLQLMMTAKGQCEEKLGRWPAAPG